MTKSIDNPPQVKPLERLLTPRDIAVRWRVDESQVRRIFKDVAGVINVATTSKHKTIRVPVAVLEREERRRQIA
jgi:hypothetical protein